MRPRVTEMILQQRLETFTGQIAVAQNPGEQPRPDDLGPMHRNCRDPAVDVAETMVAALDPDDGKSCFLQRRDDLASGEPGQSAHAKTVMR